MQLPQCRRIYQLISPSAERFDVRNAYVATQNLRGDIRGLCLRKGRPSLTSLVLQQNTFPRPPAVHPHLADGLVALLVSDQIAVGFHLGDQICTRHVIELCFQGGY